jgi:hypothetical protein
MPSRAFARVSCGGRLVVEARAAVVAAGGGAADGGTARQFEAGGSKRMISEILFRSVSDKGAESAEVESRW